MLASGDVVDAEEYFVLAAIEDLILLEAEHRMQLDPVRRDPGLTVEEVEERHPDDLRPRARPRCTHS
jgi:hypothetical protein